jgi:oligopeptide transport system permease protein
VERNQPTYWLGTDLFGRSLLVRVLVGGGISLGIGIAAAAISVFIGTLWGAIAGWVGGRVDEVMMRIVDVLYGLPYILLVVLLAVAGDALLNEYVNRERAREGYVREQAALKLTQLGQDDNRDAVSDFLKKNRELQEKWNEEARLTYPEREWSPQKRTIFDLVILLVAIGGVSWLTMARVVRGQVLSLKGQPFMEAAKAIGVPWHGVFLRHLLPNLTGPIIVYATLTVPQAILQESFLSFLGIGVKPPLPSWGNLASEGLSELNLVDSKWWLLLFPCLLLAITLLALNFVGEGLREALDPKRSKRV